MNPVRTKRADSSPAPSSRTHFARLRPRFLAFLIDSIVLCVVQTILMYVLRLDRLEPLEGPAAANVWHSSLAGIRFLAEHPYLFTYGALFYWIYYATCESSPRQATLGKYVVGIKVTDEQGQRVSFLRASARHLCKFASVMPLFMGFLMGTRSPKRQMLHDWLTGCYLVCK